MYAVIFEVEPKAEHRQHYLDTAAALKQELEQVPGFISVERFASLINDNKLVSLSFWESEEAIRAWRVNVNHQSAQTAGINRYFSDFRIRVARVERDYCLADRLPSRRGQQSIANSDHDG